MRQTLQRTGGASFRQRPQTLMPYRLPVIGGKLRVHVGATFVEDFGCAFEEVFELFGRFAGAWVNYMCIHRPSVLLGRRSRLHLDVADIPTQVGQLQTTIQDYGATSVANHWWQVSGSFGVLHLWRTSGVPSRN